MSNRSEEAAGQGAVLAMLLMILGIVLIGASYVVTVVLALGVKDAIPGMKNISEQDPTLANAVTVILAIVVVFIIRRIPNVGTAFSAMMSEVLIAGLLMNIFEDNGSQINTCIAKNVLFAIFDALLLFTNARLLTRKTDDAPGIVSGIICSLMYAVAACIGVGAIIYGIWNTQFTQSPMFYKLCIAIVILFVVIGIIRSVLGRNRSAV